MENGVVNWEDVFFFLKKEKEKSFWIDFFLGRDKKNGGVKFHKLESKHESVFGRRINEIL